MDIKKKILDIIKIKGPVIPVQISKTIESDILMASAYLSELCSDGKLKISNIKLGNSPLYFLPEQESLLQNFSENLHEKEKKAYELLKEKKILRDSKLEPVIRVALREIKDFAKPLQVTSEDKKEVFWKWYLIKKEEAEGLIKSLLERKKPDEKPIEKTKEELKQPEVQKELKPVQKPLVKEKLPDNFLEEIKTYFNKNSITIKNSEIIRKNSEIDFIIEVPSKIGYLEYYCKAKNKKRVSDSDLSSAYVQGQLKKLPVLFLIKGVLTKKAKEMLNNEFKNIKINQL